MKVRTAPAPTDEALLAPDDIARRAYEIYEREGRPDGKHTDHWLRAEQELRATLS